MNKNVIDAGVQQEQLLKEYQEGDFYLSSPRGSLLGKGCFQPLIREKRIPIADQIKRILGAAKQAGKEAPVLVGAIPFDREGQWELIVPESVVFSLPNNAQQKGTDSASSFHPMKREPLPAPAHYVEGVKKGLALIHEGSLEKVVLSRTLVFRGKSAIASKPILHNLARFNPQGYTFAVNLAAPEKEKQRTFMGASPELLVSRTGNKVFAKPLAGSRPRSKDAQEDERRGKELLASKKDLHEHRVVVEAVKRALQPFCSRLIVPERPSLVQTETMIHLSTEIFGTLHNLSTSSLDLALALHPTPAVCGYPTQRAQQAIQEIEPFERGYFTGMVGWCDENGDGEWVVAIRCAEVVDNTLTVYAGAGVVAGSVPEEELQETAAKFRTVLHAIGIDHE